MLLSSDHLQEHFQCLHEGRQGTHHRRQRNLETLSLKVKGGCLACSSLRQPTPPDLTSNTSD